MHIRDGGGADCDDRLVMNNLIAAESGENSGSTHSYLIYMTISERHDVLKVEEIGPMQSYFRTLELHVSKA